MLIKKLCILCVSWQLFLLCLAGRICQVILNLRNIALLFSGIWERGSASMTRTSRYVQTRWLTAALTLFLALRPNLTLQTKAVWVQFCWTFNTLISALDQRLCCFESVGLWRCIFCVFSFSLSDSRFCVRIWHHSVSQMCRSAKSWNWIFICISRNSDRWLKADLALHFMVQPLRSLHFCKVTQTADVLTAASLGLGETKLS